MDWIAFISRFVHIVTAITLAGGLIYISRVQLPALQELGGQEGSGGDDELNETLRRRWARLVMFSIMCLILSGVYNYITTINAAKAGQIELAKFYHPVVGVKIILAFGVFFLASILSGRTPAARRMQENLRSRMHLTVLAVVVIVALASALKVGGQLSPSDASASQTAADTDG